MKLFIFIVTLVVSNFSLADGPFIGSCDEAPRCDSNFVGKCCFQYSDIVKKCAYIKGLYNWTTEGTADCEHDDRYDRQPNTNRRIDYQGSDPTDGSLNPSEV